MPDSRVYLTRTALSECLVISWEGAERAPQPQDRIILQKDGSFLTKIRPTEFDGKTFALQELASKEWWNVDVGITSDRLNTVQLYPGLEKIEIEYLMANNKFSNQICVGAG